MEIAGGLAQAADSPRHSTLGLVKHDATAAAPERDHAIEAPENGRQVHLREVRGHSTLRSYLNSEHRLHLNLGYRLSSRTPRQKLSSMAQENLLQRRIHLPLAAFLLLS